MEEYKINNDIEIDLELDFLEAVHGCNKSLVFEWIEICKLCKGLGFDRKWMEECSECNGDCVMTHNIVEEIKISKGITDNSEIKLK